MRIVVVADEPMTAAFKTKDISSQVEVQFAGSLMEVSGVPDVLFFLLSEQEIFINLYCLGQFSCPVFVNSVIQTLQDLPEAFIRINAWPGFMTGNIVEVAAGENQTENIRKIFEAMAWKYDLVADVPGFIAARIIAMIINEAYFALGDEVSTKHEIDMAMRLGTNYPHGPFEWAEKIGHENVMNLLTELSRSDQRYTPSPLLIQEIATKWR